MHFLWLIMQTLWLHSAVLIWVHFTSIETFGIRYSTNCCAAFKCFILSCGLLSSSWFHKSDLPVMRSLPGLYNKSKFGTICCASQRHQVKREQSLRDINGESINKVEVKCDTSCFFKRLIIFGICQMVTLGVGWENISMFPLTRRWMWTLLLPSSKTLYHPQCGACAENPVRRAKSLISLSILRARILFHLLEMSLCACRGWGPTKGIGMFQSPSRFHWFSQNVGWINCS